MARNSKRKPQRAFVCATCVAFLLFLGIEAQAQPNEVLRVQMLRAGQIELEVRERLSGSVDEPVIHLFEIVKVGETKRMFERRPGITRRLVDGRLVATLDIVPPSANFDHFEVEVRNYVSETESTPQSFRATVTSITMEIVAAENRSIELRFKGPGAVDWSRFQTWITTQAVPAASVTIIVPDSPPIQARVTNASNLEAFPNEFYATFNLDRSLPLGSKVTLTIGPNAFPANPQPDDLPLALLAAPVGPVDVRGAAQEANPDRDPMRLNVLEVGGNYNTSIKLDPDPTTNEEPERETEATLDLRLAAPTITFAERFTNTSPPRFKGYSTWTPVELDAQVSNGKLTGDSISTNTIRLFTQLQKVFNSTGSGNISFYRLVGEGGLNADRDLRTIEYTGLADFRWNPGFLTRVIGKNDAGREFKIAAEFIPIGVELGHRQVRRDPLFEADNFIRRLRFGAKFELVKAPHFEFSIEDRMWWRGEFAENKFKNFFTTSFTYFPISGETNSSAGIFFSYERGALPPFTTQRSSTLKMGFRVRRKNW